MKEDTLVIHEIYASIQGESTFAGLPCTFVRTTGCNLRCAWCDSPHAFYDGTRMRREDVLAKALALETPLVEVTGGEPLLQPGVVPLLTELCDAGRTVLIETSGEADVSKVDVRVHKIMDLKAPGSGESRRNRWSNLEHISERDEIKFVLASRADYEWMRDVIRERTEDGAREQGPRRMGARRQAAGPGPAADAQVHLAAGRDRRLSPSPLGRPP